MAQGPDPIAMTDERPTGTARIDLLVPAAASLAAFVLVIVFFAPRFMYWPGIDLDSAEHHPPEFNRAIDTLRQLDHPFVPITNPTNRVINWRLLFPILGHYLRLPHWAFLGLPALGCLLVLGYVAHLVRRESGTRWAALAASALTGTTSWFFVSTGWLAYFDSWYVLGLLVAAFGRSKVATGLACLLTPWVDERFVLALPLVVVVRGISSGGIEKGSSAQFRSEALRFFALMAPYCAVRLVALATGQDEGSAFHLRVYLATVHSAREVAYGLWSGLRWLWVFVAVAPAVLISKGRAAQAGVLLLAVAATVAANVPLATDLSRSASTTVPAAVLGIVLLVRARPSLAGWLLAAALALNLLTPARHVIEGWDDAVRISPLYIELGRLKHPPPALAYLYLMRVARFAEQGQLPRALAEVETAIRIDPKSAAAQINRGVLLNDLGRPAEAAACYVAAVRLDPGLPEALLRRARFRLAHGQLTAAEQELRWAIDLAPAGSPGRAALERELAGLRRAPRQP
jgi:tetratricopeptide (TPR) repeat protein